MEKLILLFLATCLYGNHDSQQVSKNITLQYRSDDRCDYQVYPSKSAHFFKRPGRSVFMLRSMTLPMIYESISAIIFEKDSLMLYECGGLFWDELTGEETPEPTLETNIKDLKEFKKNLRKRFNKLDHFRGKDIDKNGLGGISDGLGYDLSYCRGLACKTLHFDNPRGYLAQDSTIIELRRFAELIEFLEYKLNRKLAGS